MTEPERLDREAIRARDQAATPGPWLLGWWGAQAESQCDCASKGALLGKRPQKDYPGAGPYHVHESDFFADKHQITTAPPTCLDIAFSGGIADPADAEFIAHAREDVPLLLGELERLRSEMEPGTAIAIVQTMFEQAHRLGHSPYSAKHALAWFVEEIERLRSLVDSDDGLPPL